MYVVRRLKWEIPERLATPEHLFFNRRALLAAISAAGLGLLPGSARAQRISNVPDATQDLYPVKRNEKFALDRPITEEKINTNYNNFYEFGSSKYVGKAAQALKLRPWTIKVDGMVQKPQEIGIDDLIRRMPLEERTAAKELLGGAPSLRIWVLGQCQSAGASSPLESGNGGAHRPQ